MDTHEIAVVDGDGIGPEVCAATIEVLEAAVGERISFRWTHLEAGAENFLKSGVALPEETIEACRKSDAILLGAAGLPGVLYEDGTEAGQDTTLRLRFELDLYANLRPIRSYEGVRSPLEGQPKIDYTIVRENSEGLYASRGGGNILRGEAASDTIMMTRKGIERIARTAAEVCLQGEGAPGDGKRRVTICDKANVLRSYAFFRTVAEETLSEYPEIEVEYALVDALSMYLVSRPSHYNVIVTDNMFGDILSDLGAATVAGLGMAPSSEIGASHALFQASHGSAPDIAGKGVANPVATILSGASLLDYLGKRNDDAFLCEKSLAVRDAVSRALAGGQGLTRDLGGSAGTQECVDAIVACLG